MAQRQAIMVRIRIHKRGEPAENRTHLRLAEHLPDSPLEYVARLWEEADEETLLDERHSRIYIPSTGRFVDDTIILKAQTGSYGENGQLVDIQTRQLAANIDPQQAATASCRIGIRTVDEKTVLAVVEQSRNGHFRQPFEKALRAGLDKSYTWDFETITRGDVWLKEQAELKKVTVFREQKSADSAVTDSTVTEGVLSSSFSPANERQNWLHKLLRKEVSPYELLAFPNMEEDDTVKLEVTDGEQSRTFVLDDPRTPRTRELIPTTQADGVASDKEFSQFCAKAASDLEDDTY